MSMPPLTVHFSPSVWSRLMRPDVRRAPVLIMTPRLWRSLIDVKKRVVVDPPEADMTVSKAGSVAP